MGPREPSRCRRSGAEPSYGAEPVGDVLSRLMADLELPAATLVEALDRCWADIAGPVARVCRIEGARGPVLYVVADDPVSASEMKWAATQVLEALNEAVPEAGLTELRVRVERVKAAAQRC